MKTVRIFYKKCGRLKFISHLDMTRFMARLIAKSKIPVWYTEGFNQHIYLNFALPLSLGFESLYEVLEIRFSDDLFSLSDCLAALKKVSPDDIEFFAVCEPVYSMKDIGFSEYELDISDCEESAKEKLTHFLNSESILCEKKGKKGNIKQIDLIPKIESFDINDNTLRLLLVAGVEDNLNPTLVMDTFFAKTDTPPFFYSVTRTDILTKDKKRFS